MSYSPTARGRRSPVNLWQHKYRWTENQQWYLPDGEEMMKAQLATALDEQVDAVVGACRRRWPDVKLRTAIQAGGAFGLYPLALAAHFSKVYTFEPLQENLSCLTRNFSQAPELAQHCVIVPNPLWEQDDVKMWMRYPKDKKNSYGAHCLTQKDRNGEEVVTMSIDLMKREDVDLIWLDIEGAELRALKGACWTISRNRPVVVVENRDLSQMREYGTQRGQAVKWVCNAWSYRVVGQTHADTIMVPSEWK